jgi:hypothetical protein
MYSHPKNLWESFARPEIVFKDITEPKSRRDNNCRDIKNDIEILKELVPRINREKFNNNQTIV